MNAPSVYAIATLDTKGAELQFVADCLRRLRVPVRVVDVGTGAPPTVEPDTRREAIAELHPNGKNFVLDQKDRGAAVTAMSEALLLWLSEEYAQGKISGVIGLGGTGGTALLAPAFQALPIGLPKLLVSTVASGDTRAYVDCSDITLMPSVVDVAGLNAVSTVILSNAAHALAGMVSQAAHTSADKPAVGMTMFGVTTPCVTAVRKALEEQGYDVLVFHATGVGGRAMEKLVASGFLQGALDITTTEVADEIVGGIFPAGPRRFEAILRQGIPYVLSLGGLDMVNFGAKSSVPERFQNRKLHCHNAQITLMRTTPEENRQAARWMTGKLNQSTAPFTLFIPEKGVSALDAEGQTFFDPEADSALFTELEAGIVSSPGRTIRRLPLHINDPAFAAQVTQEFLQLSKV